jgi:hypothetical protein
VLERKLEWSHIKVLATRRSTQSFGAADPQILARSEEPLEKAKQWFLDRGVAPSKVRYEMPMVWARQEA